MKKLLILICLLWNTTSYADMEKYDLFGMTMPMMCGLPVTVDQYIKDNGFTAINISFGKENAKEDGEIVFAITYYINDKRQTLAVAESPTDPYKCMIFHTFDMIMNENLLSGTNT
jgi:hypothetical protein